MERLESETEYRPLWLWLGGLIATAGFAVLAYVITEHGLWPFLAGDLITGAFGFGPFLLALRSVLGMIQALVLHLGAALPDGLSLLGVGAAIWLGGWALVAAGVKHLSGTVHEKSAAAGAPLHPALAGYRDFYWGTLLAYGGGILLSELLLIFIHTVLASGVPVEGEAARTAVGLQLSPTAAFTVALLIAAMVAFAAGAIGAARARRIAVPEATIGIFYLGLPIPILLTAIGLVPALQLSLGFRLKEILYLASLLGRPEIGFWVIFALLVLAMVMGITSGFVATGSGRIDLRTGFERFVAWRHVPVFRPRLLLGIFAVLALGIIPPIIIYAIVRATAATVEKTRIRRLGLADPLRASAAIHDARRREQSPTAMMTALSVGGVGVGVMSLIVVLSVMSGFEADLQKKILGTNSHAVILKYADSMPEYDKVMAKVRSIPGVIGQTPFIMNEVMISSEGNIAGTIIKGIDPASVSSVTDLAENLLPPAENGKGLENLDHPEQIKVPAIEALEGLSPEDLDIIRSPGAAAKGTPLPGIIIGRELAQSLRVTVGDRVNIVSPVGGELGPQGPMPKSRPFRVAGIFYSGMFEYDSKFVYIRLDEAERFFGVDGATGIELKFQDVDDARRLAKTILAKLGGYPYRTRDWGEMNKNLFSALRLEKLVMGIILSIIVIVAAGLIVATVIMLVLEKRKEIAVLKALGVPDGGIVKIFLTEGLQIGIAGGGLGLLAGLGWCFFIERVGIKLDPEVYYIPSLPVRIEPVQTAIAVLIAILVTYLGSIYPALKASRVEPVEGLKAE